MSSSEGTVDLGFLEKQDAWLLTNKFFPSKVGGRPAWLELENLPSAVELKCTECYGELTFLCQVYAPLDEYEHCFHRTIFVFLCTNRSCWQPNTAKNILVLRSQLARENTFYDFEQASEEVESDAIPSPIHLCTVCGCRGPSSCGKCRSAFYCGAAHQRLDWTQGEHKMQCGTPTTIKNRNYVSLFAEHELVIETEQLPSNSSDETAAEAEQRRLKEYEEFLKNKKEDDDLKDVPDDEFQKYAAHIDEDVLFGKFRKKVDLEKEQVLRFERNGTPLWITDRNTLKENEVPACERCGSKRIFEFQIMPQLLLSLRNENLDWGILAVYTCEQSCDTDSHYVKEFVYKQDCLDDSQDKK